MKPGILVALGKVTFKEIVRDKVLYNAVFCAVLLIALSYFLSKLTFGNELRILLDFGISGMNLSLSLISILIGSMLLNKEFERRTAYLALAKPISRSEFFLGKFMGFSLVILLNGLILCAVFLMIYLGLGGALFPTLVWALIFLIFQAWLVGTISMLFSVVSTTSVSVMFGIGFYLVGNSISQIRFLETKSDFLMSKGFLKAVSIVFPNLEILNLGLKVTYELPVANGYIVSAVGYFLFSMMIVLLLAVFLMNRKEI